MSSRLSLLFAIGVLLWVLLLVFQSLCGPFDGYVAAHLRAPGAGLALGPFFVRLFGGLVEGRITPQALLALYSLLLVMVPVGWAWIITLALRRDDLSSPGNLRGVVLGTVVLLGLLSFGNLTYLSNDLYLYRAYGVMLAKLGLNPYRELPTGHLPSDELLNVPWSNEPSAYGPLALGIFRLADLVAPGFVGGFWVLKLLLSLPLFILLAAIPLRRRLSLSEKMMCLAWIGLNPLLLLEVHQNSHLEGWAGGLLLLAALALRKASHSRAVLAGLLFGAVCGLKVSFAVVVGPLLAFLLRQGRDARGKWSYGIGMGLGLGVAALAVQVAGYAPLWAGAQTFAGLERLSSMVFRSIPFAMLKLRLATASSLEELSVLGSIAAVLLGAAACWKGLRPEVGMITSLAVQAVLARTFFQPWYVCPLVILALPAVIAREGPRTMGAILVWSASSVAGGYAPFLIGGGTSAPWQHVSLAIIMIPPLLALVSPGARRAFR